jgi:hypothetical protein|tara:strand:+ start:865 stop:2013 length:1149 start_codon:yes stop_codon:yes gene_type:complete
MDLKVISGRINGKILSKSFYFVELTADEKIDCNYGFDVRHKIPLEGNLIAVDLVSQERKTGGGVGGAAAGATLGFLLAGPLGTAVGAGMGRHSKGQESTTVNLTFLTGDSLMLEIKDLASIGIFQRWVALNAVRLSSTHLRQLDSAQPAVTASSKKKSQKEKPSSDVQMKKALPGRANKTVDLPEIEILKDWKLKAEEHGEPGLLCYSFIKEFAVEYNNFKWRTFDKKLKSKKELEKIAAAAVSKAAYISGRVKNDLNRRNEIKFEEGTTTKIRDKVISDTEILSKKLQSWQMFGKGALKKELKNKKSYLNEIDQRLAKLVKQDELIVAFLRKFKDFGSLKTIETDMKLYFETILPAKIIKASWTHKNEKPLTKNAMHKISQ